MDSNYKNGPVFSDGQRVARRVSERIQKFAGRQKHTYDEIKSLIGQAIKQIDFSGIKTLCIENLKSARNGTCGKFPRSLNRRMSHWLYAYIADLLARRCEERGVRLESKSPAYTSTTCPVCDKCDRRSREGFRFKCRHCGFSSEADLVAALKRLGEAGVYGLRLLKSWSLV